MKPVTADDVAKVIESTVRKPKPELWVPRWTQGMAKFGLPCRGVVQRGMAKAFRADNVLAERDDRPPGPPTNAAPARADALSPASAGGRPRAPAARRSP